MVADELALPAQPVFAAACALMLVLSVVLGVAKRRTGTGRAADVDADVDTAGEGTPLMGGAPCAPTARADGTKGGAARPAVVALAAVVLIAGLAFVGPSGLGRLLGTGGGGTGAAATHCMTSDEQLLAGAYDVRGLGGLGLPPVGRPFWRVRTVSPKAQRLFDQGVLLAFGFNHAEAIRNLEAARRHDPRCVMCAWALAYCYGPYVNAPMSEERSMTARRIVDEALELVRADAADAAADAHADGAAETEWVRALDRRYAADSGAFAATAQAARDEAYSEALGAIVAARPDDLNAAALYADSLMTRFPWDYFVFKPTTSRRPGVADYRPEGARARAEVERVLAREPSHPLALHLLVHLTESSDTPSDGLPAAHALAAGAAGGASSHLVHMAGHAYLNTGAYANVTDVNARAVRVDEAYAARCLEPYFPGHQRGQLQAGALFEARAALALAHAAPASALDAAAQSAHIQGLFALPRPLVRARFAHWGAILGADAREDEGSLAGVRAHPFTAAIWSYARALALLRTGARDAARAEAAALRAHAAQIPPPSLPAGHVFEASHRKLGGLMNDTVAAALALDAADLPAALGALRGAVGVQDALPYMEPEHWYLPVRLCLGALMLRAGDAAGARAEYDEDLRQHPNSGWALLGKRDALRALGEHDAAASLQPRIDAAFSRADTPLAGTCCELGMC